MQVSAKSGFWRRKASKRRDLRWSTGGGRRERRGRESWGWPGRVNANRRTAFFATWAFAGFGGRDCALWHWRERRRHQIPGFWKSGFVKPQVAGTWRGNLVRTQKAKTPNSRIPENRHNKTPGRPWLHRDFGAQQTPKGAQTTYTRRNPRTARARGVSGKASSTTTWTRRCQRSAGPGRLR